MEAITLKSDNGNDFRFTGKRLWAPKSSTKSDLACPALYVTKGGTYVVTFFDDNRGGRHVLDLGKTIPGAAEKITDLIGWGFYGKSMLEALGINTVTEID